MTEENTDTILPISLEKEMRKSYLDYAMSVIVGRALPDARDGLKPVHRRVLYAMKEMGSGSRSPYKKSARIVGDTMGKYHPHGDQAIYDTMVRMAQDFSLRYPLVDGQGNFGSIDGDKAAAMRYTESRLATIADTVLSDLDEETVDFRDNYDGSLQEPSVLPGLLPGLLVNGSSGIAVGMATKIPPHNLRELVSSLRAILDNNDITVDNAMMTNYSENARFNLSGGQNTGMYGSGILAHNILEKWMEKYEVIYDGPLDKIMAETIGLNGPEDKQFKDFNTWQHSGLMSHNYLYNIHHLGEKSHYPLHDMKKTNLRANIIKFDIPGDTNIFAGNVIQLMIPTHIHNHNLPEDQYLTGNWLVTAIHHKISNAGYVCTLECMKDGFFGDPDVVIPERAWETGGYNAYANEFDGI